jgi:NADH-quinone oxidoreductase subunit J
MEATLVETIIFGAFGVMAVAGALSVILSREVVYSALGLLANFSALGALYIMLSAEFLGIVQWIVYSGAIVVLFLFAMMLIGGRSVIDEARFRPFINWIAVGLGVLLLGEIGYLVLSAGIAGQVGTITPAVMAETGNVELLGMALFTDYLLPFELASVLLLVGIVGAVAIGKSRRPA